VVEPTGMTRKKTVRPIVDGPSAALTEPPEGSTVRRSDTSASDPALGPSATIWSPRWKPAASAGDPGNTSRTKSWFAGL
jgi:hypothetical protein